MKKHRLCRADMSDRTRSALLRDKLVMKDETVQDIHEFVYYAQAFAKTAGDSVRYYSATVQQQMEAIGDIGSEDDFRDNRKNFKYMKHLHSTIVMCENIGKFLNFSIRKLTEFAEKQEEDLDKVKSSLSSAKQASPRIRHRMIHAGFFDSFKKKVKEKAKDIFHYDRKSDRYKAWSTGDFGSEEIYAYCERAYKEANDKYRKIYDITSTATSMFLNDLKGDKDKFQSNYDIDLSNDIDCEAIIVTIESNNRLLKSYVKDMKAVKPLLDKPQKQLEEAYNKVMDY